ncbi:MAG: hypothetical protein V7L04_17830 [Nostoc sp.]|uniref:hypothetical protein n=1 Tax=Nostoc sp. TaxID=1180 RepID=UPI002FFD34E0
MRKYKLQDLLQVTQKVMGEIIQNLESRNSSDVTQALKNVKNTVDSIEKQELKALKAEVEYKSTLEEILIDFNLDNHPGVEGISQRSKTSKK